LVTSFTDAENFLIKKGYPWEPLIKKIGPCRLKISDDLLPYQSIIKSIFYQQLHPKAGDAIFTRFMQIFENKFPTPKELIQRKKEFEQIGLSKRKRETIMQINLLIDQQKLPISLQDFTRNEIETQYTQVKGVGIWTVQMMLIFNQGFLDIMPCTDFAIRKNFSTLMNLENMITPKKLEAESLSLKPYRSIAAWYLWQLPQTL
jgi:DNA-3-methyladenine glycosylase II